MCMVSRLTPLPPHWLTPNFLAIERALSSKKGGEELDKCRGNF